MTNLTPEQRALGRENANRALGITRRDWLKAAAATPAVGAFYFGYKGLEDKPPVRAAIIGTGNEGCQAMIRDHNRDYLNYIGFCDARPSQRERAVKVSTAQVTAAQEMVTAAEPEGKPLILVNPKLGDIQSAAGVMSVRGRQGRLDFLDTFVQAYHFRCGVRGGACGVGWFVRCVGGGGGQVGAARQRADRALLRMLRPPSPPPHTPTHTAQAALQGRVHVPHHGGDGALVRRTVGGAPGGLHTLRARAPAARARSHTCCPPTPAPLFRQRRCTSARSLASGRRRTACWARLTPSQTPARSPTPSAPP